MKLVTDSLWHCVHVIRAGSVFKPKTIMLNWWRNSSNNSNKNNSNRLLIIGHEEKDNARKCVEVLSKMSAIIRASAAHAAGRCARRSIQAR